MKIRTLLIASALTLVSTAWAGPNDADHKPVHGGVLATVKDIDYELVANATSLRLYVRDHGKAVDLTKASAKLTMLNGADKQEVDLKPSGDKLEATGTFKIASGTKIAVAVTNSGKQATVRFVIK